MRHVSRTHWVALDWLLDRINLDPKIQIKYIDTKNQLADMLTKGKFTRDEWNHLLCLFNISHFSSTDYSEVMSKKKTQKDSGEERVTAKSKSIMNFIARCSERTLDVIASTASARAWKTRHESQFPLSSRTEEHHRTRTESGWKFGEKCSYAHRQVDEQPSKCLRLVTNVQWLSWRSMSITKEQGDLLRMLTHQIHDVFQFGAAEVFIWVAYVRIWIRRSCHQSHGRAKTCAETNPACEVHKGYCTSYQNSRPKSIARNDLPRWTSSA